MLICVKIIKKIFNNCLFYVNLCKKKKCFSSDGQTDVQLKTIVRNLTKPQKKIVNLC